MTALPPTGRVYRARRRVRLADVGTDGQVRLDALARYLQDVAGDDSDDAALPDPLYWVVRRSVIEQSAPLRFREQVELATFCSGLGSRWAERRVTMTGEAGGRAEAVTVWVHVDPVTGRPAPLGDAFEDLYREASGGREVDGRLRHIALDGDEPGVVVVPWRSRLADLDVLDHVTNAVAWAVVEEAVVRVAASVGGGPPWASLPRRTEVEYRDPIDRRLVTDGPGPVVLARAGKDRLEVTVRGGEGPRSPVFVTALVTPPQPLGATTRP
jgi:acyl-ACP thioesterase